MPVPQQSLPDAQFVGTTAPPKSEPCDHGAPDWSGGDVPSMKPAISLSKSVRIPSAFNETGVEVEPSSNWNSSTFENDVVWPL